MKVAIVGAGTTGAYCYRLLKNKGFQVHIYGRKPETACGINPCAWGTSEPFLELTSAAGLNPEAYILRRFDSVMMDDVPVKGKLMTFDKPVFIKDLLGSGMPGSCARTPGECPCRSVSRRPCEFIKALRKKNTESRRQEIEQKKGILE